MDNYIGQKELHALGGFEYPRPPARHEKTQGNEFESILTERLNLSSHAETRIRSREVPWTEDIQQRIEAGMDLAQSKGSREALILADGVAVIANVKSRTVITAMDSAKLYKGKIFTNIDSTVLV